MMRILSPNNSVFAAPFGDTERAFDGSQFIRADPIRSLSILTGYAFAAPRMHGEPGRLPTAEMARRKLYPKSTRVRLTDEEHRRIGYRAQRTGLSISRYLIENALREGAMTSDEKEHAEADRFQRDWAISEVARVGNNVNQIARQLNSQRGGITSERIEGDLSAVAEALNDLRRLWAQQDAQ